MLKKMDSSKLMKVNGGNILGTGPDYWIRLYINGERSPEEQARIREVNRQHYGY